MIGTDCGQRKKESSKIEIVVEAGIIARAVLRSHILALLRLQCLEARLASIRTWKCSQNMERQLLACNGDSIPTTLLDVSILVPSSHFTISLSIAFLPTI